MELEENYEVFEALNAVIVSIAQIETDPAMLPRITEFVHNSFPIVADPEQETREAFDIFSVYLIDKEGILQTHIPGIKEARPRLDIILTELAKLEGVAPPEVEDATGRAVARMPGAESQTKAISSAEAVGVRWMWSVDAVAPGDAFKLAFMVTIADGYHVYGNDEERMTPFALELELPKGVELARPIDYPHGEAKMDPILKIVLSAYEDVIPMPTIRLKASEDLAPGKLTATAKIHYQTCNETVCYPPTVKEIALPLNVVSLDIKREKVAGSDFW